MLSALEQWSVWDHGPGGVTVHTLPCPDAPGQHTWADECAARLRCDGHRVETCHRSIVCSGDGLILFSGDWNVAGA